MFVLVRVAEAGGFEPPVPCGTLAFKASAFGRSATLPGCTLRGAGSYRRGAGVVVRGVGC